MRVLFFSIVFLSSLFVARRCEASQGMVVVSPYCGYACYPPSAYDRIWRFDDRVFDLPGSAPQPSTRSYGHELDYDSAQRRAWMKDCAPQKEVSWQAFRECFREHARQNQEALAKSREAIERKQSRPLRNVPPLNPNLD